MAKRVLFVPTDPTPTVGTNVLTLADAKTWLRVDGTDEDDLITDLISVAVNMVENECRTYLTPRAGSFQFSAFFDTHLPVGPLRSISDVTYLTTQEFTAYYATEDATHPTPFIHFDSPPSLDTEIQYPINVNCTVGYDDIPPTLLQAVRWLLTAFYDQRQDFVVGTVAAKLPLTVMNLIAPYRNMYFSYAGG